MYYVECLFCWYPLIKFKVSSSTKINDLFLFIFLPIIDVILIFVGPLSKKNSDWHACRFVMSGRLVNFGLP
jgi:hypothetical protein